jgi:hypothetical protein
LACARVWTWQIILPPASRMRSVKGVGSQRTTLPPPASHREPHPAPPQWRRNLLALVQSNWSFRQALLDRKLVRRARSCGGPPRVTRLAAHASPETLIEGPPAWRQLSNQTSGGARSSQSKATGSNSLLHDVAQSDARARIPDQTVACFDEVAIAPTRLCRAACTIIVRTRARPPPPSGPALLRIRAAGGGAINSADCWIIEAIRLWTFFLTLFDHGVLRLRQEVRLQHVFHVPLPGIERVR